MTNISHPHSSPLPASTPLDRNRLSGSFLIALDAWERAGDKGRRGPIVERIAHCYLLDADRLQLAGLAAESLPDCLCAMKGLRRLHLDAMQAQAQPQMLQRLAGTLPECEIYIDGTPLRAETRQARHEDKGLPDIPRIARRPGTLGVPAKNLGQPSGTASDSRQRMVHFTPDDSSGRDPRPSPPSKDKAVYVRIVSGQIAPPQAQLLEAQQEVSKLKTQLAEKEQEVADLKKTVFRKTFAERRPQLFVKHPDLKEQGLHGKAARDYAREHGAWRDAFSESMRQRGTRVWRTVTHEERPQSQADHAGSSGFLPFSLRRSAGDRVTHVFESPAHFEDELGNRLKRFDARSLDMAQLAKSLNSLTHRKKTIEGGHHDGWWRAAWLSVLLQRNPAALKEHIVGALGDAYASHAEQLRRMGAAAQQDAGRILTAGPGTGANIMKTPSKLKLPDDAADHPQAEEIIRQLSAALLLQGGARAEEAMQTVRGSAQASDARIFKLIGQLGGTGVIFNKPRGRPWDITICPSRSEYGELWLQQQYASKEDCTRRLLDQLDFWPVLIARGKQVDLYLPVDDDAPAASHD